MLNKNIQYAVRYSLVDNPNHYFSTAFDLYNTKYTAQETFLEMLEEIKKVHNSNPNCALTEIKSYNEIKIAFLTRIN